MIMDRRRNQSFTRQNHPSAHKSKTILQGCLHHTNILPISTYVQTYSKSYQFRPLQYDAALAWAMWRASAVMVVTNQDNTQRSTSNLVNTMNRILILANVVSPPTINETITDHVKHAYPRSPTDYPVQTVSLPTYLPSPIIHLVRVLVRDVLAVRRTHSSVNAP